jgi:hypothetical protein
VSHQSPAPGFGKKNWNLSGFPSRSLESDGGGFLIEMFGQTFANSAFSRNHFSSPGWVSGLIASTGHSGTQTPQSMHSSGWMTTCSWVGMAEGWHWGTALPLLGSMRGYPLKIRERNGPLEPGMVGKVWGGRPEAAGVGHPQKVEQAGEHLACLMANHPRLRRSIVSRGKAMRPTRAWRGPICLYQFLERNRQRPITRGEFAEQIAVEIIHLRANEDSDLSPVAPDPAVSNDGYDLRRFRIKNDVLGKDEILSHGFASKTTGWREKPLASTTGQGKNPLLT